jgi:hypothetical protein
MNSMKTLGLVGGLALAAAGCAAPETLHSSFGNAVAQNKALHIIDPVPADPNLPAPDLNGARAALAMDRYLKGQVIAPEKMATTNK